MNRKNLVVALGALTLPTLAALAVRAGEPAPAAPAAAPAPAAASCNVDAAGAKPEDHAAHAAASSDREQVDADGVVRRGAKLSKDGELVTVSSAVKRGKELDGKKIKLQGKVTDVCTKMGCWFVVQGDKPEDTIRISTKSHSIFVPMKAVGYTATVEGTLTVRTVTKEQAQHYENERTLKAGETHKTITADQTELFIDVAGLEMKKG